MPDQTAAFPTRRLPPLARGIALLLGIVLWLSGMAPSHATPLPHPRPAEAKTATPIARPAIPPATRTAVRAPTSAPLVAAPTAATSQADMAALSRVIALSNAGKSADATFASASITDPLARKLAEWIILRSDNNGAPTERYAAFITANPSWPSLGFLRRRAEAALWDDRRDDAVVLGYFAREKPHSAKGRFILARALLSRGDRAGAQRLVREAWHGDSFSAEVEARARDIFAGLISTADDKARMDYLLYAENAAEALHFAKKAGGANLAIAKARIAVSRRARNAGHLLDAVPTHARHDPVYIFSRIQWLRRNDREAEAAKLMLGAPREAARLVNLDEWWIERRILIRKMLDDGKPADAYRIARDAARPTKRTYQTDQEFTAGWIALRFLNDPATALAHFTKIAPNTSNPTALARAGYWHGRAAEALGRRDEARAAYEQASIHSTTYYGQLARGRLGLSNLAFHNAPPAHGHAAATLEIVRALELLYAADATDLAIPILAEMGERAPSEAIAAMLEVTRRHKDARGTLLIAKDAVNRGLPFDDAAWPTFGIPNVTLVGPDIHVSVVYAIARQESGLNPRVVSPANAMGLMQVTPAAGRYVAKKFNVRYDGRRLLNDSVYNVQMGAAELADLIQDYRGSYIMSFAAYNAGRTRLKQWVERYGDPRDPKVDAVDWVERIPFAETRNYVQRVLENLQVYRARFGGGTRLMIEADIRRGQVE